MNKLKIAMLISLVTANASNAHPVFIAALPMIKSVAFWMWACKVVFVDDEELWLSPEERRIKELLAQKKEFQKLTNQN